MGYVWVRATTVNGEYSGSNALLLGQIAVGYVWRTPKNNWASQPSYTAQLHLPKGMKATKFATREEAEAMLEAALTSWLMNAGLLGSEA